MIFKCKMCGSPLEVSEGMTVCTCEYCGTKQTIPNVDDERKLNLFNKANSLIQKNEFDKAISVYQTLVSDFPQEAEAYWGLCLCNYGIEYVDDPRTGDKVPTCHRTLFESIFDDPDYLNAIKYADPIAKEVYISEAKEIDRIQKRIINISQKEEPYDIFICYKETGYDGQRTQDSVLAQDIYDKLTETGYRVFFSRISLENKLGLEYEPIIFAALRSSKVMLVVGTKEEHFNAPWVKNEWSRFLSFMKNDKDKYLIPCFKNIDAYDMPQVFLPFQSLDMGKIGYLQDLVRGISKILNIQNNNENSGRLAKSNKIDDYFEAADLAMMDKDYPKADWNIESIIATGQELPEAYLYKLAISRSLRFKKDLWDETNPVDDDLNYKLALKYSVGTPSYNSIVNLSSKIKENKKISIYYSAKQSMESGNYANAIDLFKSLNDFRDSKQNISKCEDRIKKERMEEMNRKRIKLEKEFGPSIKSYTRKARKCLISLMIINTFILLFTCCAKNIDDLCSALIVFNILMIIFAIPSIIFVYLKKKIFFLFSAINLTLSILVFIFSCICVGNNLILITSIILCIPLFIISIKALVKGGKAFKYYSKCKI